MRERRKEITKEVYEIATQNRDLIPENMREQVFGAAAVYGYGVYEPRVYEKDNKYYVRYWMGDTCD